MERNRVTNDLTDAEVENAFDQILNETGGNNLAQSPGGNFFLILLLCPQSDQVKCIRRNHLAQNNFSRTHT